MNPPHGEAPFGVVILAAGASRRMGRPKLLLPWRRTSVLGHVLDQWRILGATQIAAVMPPHQPELESELDRLGLDPAARVINPAPAEGMMSSVLCAARWQGWKPGIARIALALGDQPLIHLDSLRALVERAAAHPLALCQLALGEAAKHPVFFPRACWQSLATSRAPTLKQHLAVDPSPRELVDCDDAGVSLDLDTPADYTRACELDRRTAAAAWPPT